MANEMRDRLVELISEAEQEYIRYAMAQKLYPFDEDKNSSEFIADHLIENGVIVRKRAKWIYATDCYLCSVCAGKRFNLLLGTDAEYCPYCGAKMILDDQAEQKLKEMRGE